jgi:hypothetical protein
MSAVSWQMSPLILSWNSAGRWARRPGLALGLGQVGLQERHFPQPQSRKGQTVLRRIGLGQAGALGERLTGFLQLLLLWLASTPFAAFQSAGAQMGQQLQAQACRFGLRGSAHEAQVAA